MAFDPLKYGAIPVNQGFPAQGGFDPSKYGAISVNQAPQQPSLADSIWHSLAVPGQAIGDSLVKAGTNVANLATGGIKKFNEGLPENTIDVPKLAGDYVNAGLTIAAPGIGAGGGLAARVGANAAAGVASGAAQGIVNGDSAGKVIGGAVEQGIVGGSLGVFGGAAKIVDKLASPEYQAAKAAGKLDKSIQTSVQQTMPFQDKSIRIDELRNTLPYSTSGKGGVSRKGVLGKSTPDPTAQDIQRGTIAHEYIGGEKDPVARIGLVNKGIQDTSTQVDSFLDSKAAPANFADMRTYMEKNRPSASLQKDPGAAESYQRAIDSALTTLYDTMKKSAKESGDFGAQTSGKDIRAARIAIDQQITKELGENAFGTPQYRGIKAAEIDTRNLMNRMSEDMLRYPGQMESLNKMNDFIAQARSRGVEIDMTHPVQRVSLEKSFGLEPKGEAAAAKLVAEHEKMSHLYDARDNMIDRYQSSLGKNRVQEAIANSPTTKAVVGVAKRVVPFGIGTHL